MSFRRPDGTVIPTSGLDPPLKIVIDAEEAARCAFWDEEEAKWSSEDVATVSVANKSLVCSTSHLTIFGGVVEVILQLGHQDSRLYKASTRLWKLDI